MNELGSGLFRTPKIFEIEQVSAELQSREDANEMGEVLEILPKILRKSSKNVQTLFKPYCTHHPTLKEDHIFV